MRFLHASDLHIDSPLRGLDRYEGAPVTRLRTATRSALERLVDMAITEHVDFVLFAGDIYDRDPPPDMPQGPGGVIFCAAFACRSLLAMLIPMPAEPLIKCAPVISTPHAAATETRAPRLPAAESRAR